MEIRIEAMADPSRRQIVRLLREHPHRPSVLATKLDLHRSTITYHLRRLQAAGLVRLMWISVDGRSRLYALEPDAIPAIDAWLRDTGIARADGPVPELPPAWPPRVVWR